MGARQMMAPGKDKIVSQERTTKNVKKWHISLGEFLAEKEYAFPCLGVCAIGPIFMPEWFDMARIIFIFYAMFYYFHHRRIKGPGRVPKYLNVKDEAYHSRKPGAKTFNIFGKGTGICYLGHDEDQNQIWISDTDMKTHMLIFGTTGSGKTVTLQSLAFNAFTMATGLCYIDPKGDPKLAHQLFMVARRLGREDDYLALNFMTGGRKIGQRTPFRMSNTLNPFARANDDSITNLLSSLLPKEEGGNAVFQQKAQALITALVKVLVALRDAKCALPLTKNFNGIPKGKFGSGLSIITIRDYLDPVNCVGLVFPLKPGAARTDGQGQGQGAGGSGSTSGDSPYVDVKEVKRRIESGEVKEEDLSEHEAVALYVDEPILDVLKATVSSLNYAADAGEISEQQSYIEQFGYAKGYFGQPLASITGTYGHLFSVPKGEIDMGDCLFNRRILVGILPTLEKSPTECSSLGKIILASVKNSVSGALGNKLEESTKTIIGSSFASSPAPGIIVVDEYAAIMMPGFEVILTQARSLGFMAIVATQDYAGMKGTDEKSCNQIIENTSVKMFMKMASAGETWNLAKSTFGQVTVEKVNLTNPSEHGTLETTDMVSQFDLMRQIEGDFHMAFAGTLIVGKTEYFVPQETKGDILRINRLIKTDTNPDIIRMNLELENSEIHVDINDNEARGWREKARETCKIPEIYAVEMAA